MPVIKLPEADWGEAWRLLIQEGGTTRISKDHVYIVSGRQIENYYRTNSYLLRYLMSQTVIP